MARSSPPGWLRDSWREYKELVAALSPVPLRGLLFHRRFERIMLAYAVIGGSAAAAVLYFVATGHPWIAEIQSLLPWSLELPQESG